MEDEDESTEKLRKFLIYFVIFVIAVKWLAFTGFFVEKVYKGKGFAASIPPGWVRVKTKRRGAVPQDMNTVLFIPSHIDLEKLEDGMLPEAQIALISTKLDQPLWMEDEFPSVVTSLRQAGYDVKDQGQLKIDDVIAYWVFYHEDDRINPRGTIEFYLITESSYFFKLVYSAHPNKFNTYREGFEYFRENFDLVFALF